MTDTANLTLLGCAPLLRWSSCDPQWHGTYYKYFSALTILYAAFSVVVTASMVYNLFFAKKAKGGVATRSALFQLPGLVCGVLYHALHVDDKGSANGAPAGLMMALFVALLGFTALSFNYWNWCWVALLAHTKRLRRFVRLDGGYLMVCTITGTEITMCAIVVIVLYSCNPLDRTWYTVAWRLWLSNLAAASLILGVSVIVSEARALYTTARSTRARISTLAPPPVPIIAVHTTSARHLTTHTVVARHQMGKFIIAGISSVGVTSFVAYIVLAVYIDHIDASPPLWMGIYGCLDLCVLGASGVIFTRPVTAMALELYTLMTCCKKQQQQQPEDSSPTSTCADSV